jgi:hypothetical protein
LVGLYQIEPALDYSVRGLDLSISRLGGVMAIIAMFEVEGADAAKYDDVIRRLTAIGQKVPDGQLFHVSYGDPARLQVIEVFENRAKLDAFGAKLGPILQEVGIKAKPTIHEVYNIIQSR